MNQNCQDITLHHQWALGPVSVVSPSVTGHGKALIFKRGKIEEIGDFAELGTKYSHLVWMNGENYVVSPGLINSHTHVAMGFMRDLTRNHSNMIEDIFFPRESRLKLEWMEALSYSYIYDGLRSGVTCFVDHYYLMDGICRAIQKFGLKGVIAETMADLGGAFPDKDHSLWKKNKEWIENWSYGEDLVPAVGPHAGNTVSTVHMKEMAEFAKAHNLPIHLHLSQTFAEREYSLKEYGLSPVEWAESCGALGEKTLAVHLVSCDEKDLDILKRTGTSAGFCPASQILYEQLAPIKGFIDKEIPVAVGTDCPASNDRGDAHDEMRMMALLARDRGYKENALQQVLASTTSIPAKTFGLNIGDFKEGLCADVVFWKKDLSVLPINDLLSNFIFSFSSRQVEHVLVNGQWKLWQKEPVDISETSARTAYEDALGELQKALDS